MEHIITYPGLVKTSLGLMQEKYMEEFLPWPNLRIGVEGTLQRSPYSIASGIEWVKGLDKLKGKDEVFAVLLHTNESDVSYRYVGHMGIHKITWPHGFATTGSILGDPAGRGRGYGTEAKLLLLYHAFMIVGVRKVTSTVKAWNGASLGHLIKCGYTPVGRFKKHHLHEGRFVDEIILEVFREDWEPIWNSYQETKTLPALSDEQRTLVSDITKSDS